MKLFFITHVLVLLAISVQAQNYSINWFTIDGGGGTSTGGVLTVRGTIGQPDASSALTNGATSLAGGFWPGAGFGLVQTPDAPLLAAELLGGNVRIAWPLPAIGFVLDQTAALATPPATSAWSQVSFPYQTNATHISITVPSPASNRIYRLRKL